MTPRTRTALATAGLLSVLLAGCSDDPESGGTADDAATAPTAVPEPSTLWVASPEAGALVKVDAESDAVEPIKVDDGPWQVAATSDAVYVNAAGLQRVDPATNEVTAVGDGDYISGFALDEDGAWAGLRDEPKLVRYDLESGEVTDEVDLQEKNLTLEHMTIEGDRLIAENSYDGTVLAIDLTSGEVTATYSPDEVVWDVQPAGDAIWVAHYGGLVELDAATLEPRREVPDVDAAFALDLDETGQVWAGTAQSVGTVSDDGEFQPVVDAVAEKVKSGSVDDIQVSEDSVWIAHGDAGLVRLDRASQELDAPVDLPGTGAFATSFEIALQ